MPMRSCGNHVRGRPVGLVDGRITSGIAVPVFILATVIVLSQTQAFASGIDSFAVESKQGASDVPRAEGRSSERLDPPSSGRRVPSGEGSPPLELRILRQEFVLTRPGLVAGGGGPGEPTVEDGWLELLELESAASQGMSWSIVSETDTEIRLIVECSIERCAGLDSFNRRLLELMGVPKQASGSAGASDTAALLLSSEAQSADAEQAFLESIVPLGSELPMPQTVESIEGER